MKGIFSISLTFCFLFFTKVQAHAQAFSLKDALSFAIEHSPVFNTIKKTQIKRELEYQSAFSKLLPSLDFKTTKGLQNNIFFGNTFSNTNVLTPNPTAPWYSSLNLTVSENLYDNGTSLIHLSVADLNRKLAAIEYSKVRDSLALDVAHAFYRFSQACELLKVRKQQQMILDKQFRTLSSEFKQGFNTKSNFLRIKAQVQRAKIETVSAENEVQSSALELHKWMGVSFHDQNPPTFEPISVDINQNFEKIFPASPPAIQGVYDYQMNEIQKEINQKSVNLAKRNYWPRVNLSSGVSYSNLNYLNSNTPLTAGNQLSWSALLTLEYNIWDWGILKREVQVAEINRDIQENTLDQNLIVTHTKINQLMSDLLRIKKSYALSQELLSFEEESNQNLEVQYREGKVTYLDLMTSLNHLLDARVRFYSSYFEALKSIAQYKYYEGKLYAMVTET